MISARKITANRANAQASTGPKTLNGKTRSASNARRHGLSLSVISDPALSDQVESLAREIAGEKSNTELYQLARRIAEAQIDLIRIRRARHGSFAGDFNNPDYAPFKVAFRSLPRVKKYFEKFGMEVEIPLEPMDVLQSLKPQGALKVLAIRSESARQFSLMDRYERRALSRRKFAIRAFDAAHRHAMTTDHTLASADAE